MSGKPGGRLRHRAVTEIGTVGHRDALPAQFTQHIVHQLINGIRNGNQLHLRLHSIQFLQREGRRHFAKMPILLILQDGKPRAALLHISGHYAKLKTIIERREDLFLLIPEVRHLIGRRKERDHWNVHRHALVRIPVLVERSEQRIEQTIRRFKNFVQKADVRIRDLARHDGRRRTAVQQRKPFLVLFQSCCQALHL